VDDIIITGNDEAEIRQVKDNLGKQFEVKDLSQLRYFLGIEIARSPKGIFLSQRKYILDLLSETHMLVCRSASTPIDLNHKLPVECGNPVNKEKYQILVGRLIYLWTLVFWAEASSHSHINMPLTCRINVQTFR
jgi:hypothetical protein